MGSLGFGELIVILVIAAIVLGPDKLPEVARQAGKTIRCFRNELRKMDDTLQSEIKDVTGAEELKEIKELRQELADIKKSLRDTNSEEKKK